MVLLVAALQNLFPIPKCEVCICLSYLHLFVYYHFLFAVIERCCFLTKLGVSARTNLMQFNKCASSRRVIKKKTWVFN